ncbi:MAG: hypothetical protein U5O69_01785 [Candidatus Competibacteraceae bacterium]|nr:hypothetical protein [Candidatus Competibacteraceae bacterium]
MVKGSVALKDIHHLGAAFVEALFFLVRRRMALFGGIQFRKNSRGGCDDGFRRKVRTSS